MNNSYILFCLLLISNFIFGQTWQPLNDPPFQEGGFVTATYNGKGYAFHVGELVDQYTNDVWEYDVIEDSWIQLDSDLLPKMGEACGTTIGNKVYINSSHTEQGDQYFYVYDLDTQTATQLSPSPNFQIRATMQVYEDKIFMGGGILNYWNMYDIATDTWTEKTQNPSMGASAGTHLGYSFVVGEYIYVGGGHYTFWYRYHVPTDSWTTISNDAGNRHGGISHLFKGKGYILGGDTNDHQPVTNVSNYFLEYDPVADSWKSLPAILDLSRFLPGSFLIDDTIYYFGGYDMTVQDGSLLTTMYKFDLVDSTTTTTTDLSLPLEHIQLSPNPASEILNIDSSLDLSLDENNYTIYDMNGSKIHTGTLSKNVICLTALIPGNYVLTIKANDSLYRGSFVKVN